MTSFSYTRQMDSKDCGPACLRMISSYYGRNYSLQYLRDKCYITRLGVSLLGISDAAEAIGFESIGVKLTWESLSEKAPKPCIVHWNQNHFIVLERIKGNRVYVADPAIGRISYTIEEFRNGWISSGEKGEGMGMCLLLQPTPEFFSESRQQEIKGSFKFLLTYFRPYKKYLLQLVTGMVAGTAIMLVLPFLTQGLVDIGIGTSDLDFIYLILIAQLVLIAGRTSVEFIRSWLLLHISSRINIALISDFLAKLMHLPTAYFDTKVTGDILQRIGDHSRIENFFTQSSLNIIFSAFNILIFSIILAFYNYIILLVFLLGSGLYLYWITRFLKKRIELDQRRFQILTENQNSIIQIVSGMHELKLNTAEQKKRWDWEQIQARIFRLRIKGLTLNQYQQVGAVAIHEFKNILITFIAAKAVLDGQMTLGIMFAVQFIVGQMNGPIEQLITVFHSIQDARLSLDRLNEIHQEASEEKLLNSGITQVPESITLQANNLTFQYEGPRSPKVIDDLTLTIPAGKITAIVGASGSGKTTLVKLLSGLYSPSHGEVMLNGIRLNEYNQKVFRETVGAVLQDGYIFSDTIAQNIALSDINIDPKKLDHAVEMANLNDFLTSLPAGSNSRIGIEGHGLSQGQKQRVLIARAIYKNPRLLFFDEATNSLDATNERVIMENLSGFFRGRTVVIVAHRLSTVRNADQIIVLDRGKIIEQGTHDELVSTKGAYYQLVKNQLELGV